MPEAQERPSPAALRILHFLADPDEAPSLAGDMEEEYADIRDRKGSIPAALWLWFQIVISLPSFVKYYLYWRHTMFANYLRTAWRNLKKHKGFSFINIAGLAVRTTLPPHPVLRRPIIKKYIVGVAMRDSSTDMHSAPMTAMAKGFNISAPDPMP